MSSSIFEMRCKIFGEGVGRVAVREIVEDIYWVTHCLGDQAKYYYGNYFSSLPEPHDYYDKRVVDYPFSAFLIDDEQPLLIDTIAPTQRENTLRAVRHILGERQLAYIWISHIELPHAGNTPALQRLYPPARVVAVKGGDHYGVHGLENALLVSPGDVIELGRHSLEIVEPLFADHGLSQWAYERSTGFFFSADWGHNLHEPALGQCFMFLDEMEPTGYTRELFIDDVKINAWYQFPWLMWSDPDRVAHAVGELFDRYDIKILAPSHGNIIRQDMDKFIAPLKEGMRQAAMMPRHLAL
jgi:flavorubredoxin